jgi:hypothetical protein
MSDADFSGVILKHDTLHKLGFQSGDYLQIELEERGTMITRRLGCGSCEGYTGLRGNFVYMDPASVHYLDAMVDDTVRVCQTDNNFDVP